MLNQTIYPKQALWTLTLCFFALYSAGPFGSAFAKSDKTPVGLAGEWVLDEHKTRQIQPAAKKSSIFSKFRTSTNVSVGGIPLPKSSTAKVPDSRGKSKDPDVLFCKGMAISVEEETIRIDYDGLGAKTYVIGHYRGRRTSYNKKQMKTWYESTSRKVSQTYNMDGRDKMIVTITLAPNSGPKNIVKKAFTRKTTEKASSGPG
ncbi:MAG: hypothetical protein KUG75_03485 [Pseudomonadales bacterium]|nr:hypothetical protein [Pseudomonadales bacterium]